MLASVKRALLIVNPYSTHVTGARITEVENALRERIDLRTEFTQRPGHATELAADGAASDVDAILVFSGDGTYNEALNGADGEVPFGFLPGGGTSVLPRALGVPRDPVEAARAAGAAIAGQAAPDLAGIRERPARSASRPGSGSMRRRFAASMLSGERPAGPVRATWHSCARSGR